MESVHRKRNRKLLFGNKEMLAKQRIMRIEETANLYSATEYETWNKTGYRLLEYFNNIIQHRREQSGIDELVCN